MLKLNELLKNNLIMKKEFSPAMQMMTSCSQSGLSEVKRVKEKERKKERK